MIHHFTAKARHRLNWIANSPDRQTAAQADLVNLIHFSVLVGYLIIAVQTGYVQLTIAASFLESSGVKICTVHKSLCFWEHKDISCMINSLEKSDWEKECKWSHAPWQYLKVLFYRVKEIPPPVSRKPKVLTLH